QRTPLEDHLAGLPEPARTMLLRELLELELSYRRRAGETVGLEEYQQRFPEHAALIASLFREEAGELAGGASAEQDSSAPSVATRPEGPRGEDSALPAHLGRYRVTAKLGAGSFGVVYQGYDEELRRHVAIKVPHRHRVSQPEDVEAYLAEAR